MRVIDVVKKIDEIYVDFFKRKHDKYPTKHINFEYRSYSRWSLNEIREYLLQNRDANPLELLDSFLYIMTDYACRSKGTGNFIFSVACDITQFVIDEILF